VTAGRAARDAAVGEMCVRITGSAEICDVAIGNRVPCACEKDADTTSISPMSTTAHEDRMI
jgi:hypothetical protein